MRGADMLHEPSWDVVQEPEGFSAEATVEHELSLADAERLAHSGLELLRYDRGHGASAMRLVAGLYARHLMPFRSAALASGFLL
mgnify:CR=1 FL=1